MRRSIEAKSKPKIKQKQPQNNTFNHYHILVYDSGFTLFEFFS
jgi:hypothetical protein